jgi:hypothetical protein
MLPVEICRLLVGVSDGEQLSLLEQASYKGERNRSSIIAESVGQYHCRVPGQIGGDEL